MTLRNKDLSADLQRLDELTQTQSQQSKREDEAIKAVDVKQILSRAAKELRKVESMANGCVRTRTLDNSVALKPTTRQEILNYREKVLRMKLAGLPTTRVETPWSSIKVLDGIPVRAHLHIEDKIGPININLHGLVPQDLIVCVSENYQDANEATATWSFAKCQKFVILPKDQRVLANPKKHRQGELKERFLSPLLYFVFDTTSSDENDHLNTDGQFNVQVTFPGEEKLQRR